MNKLIYQPIEDAKSAKKLLNGVLLLLIAAVVFLLGGFPAIIASSFTQPLQTLFTLILTFLLPVLFIFLFVTKVEKRKIVTLGLYREGAFKSYLAGIVVGLVMYIAVMIILFVSGQASLTTETNIRLGAHALPFLLVLLPGWIFQSFAEELLCRGWLLSSLGAKYNLLVAAILSSAFFGVLHLFNPGTTALSTINIILLAFAFVIISLYFNNIWAVSGAHFSWNMTQGNIFGCNVSGNVVGGASILKTDLTGNSLITGGSFGPEAGIVSTTILILTTVIFLILIHKKKKRQG